MKFNIFSILATWVNKNKRNAMIYNVLAPILFFIPFAIAIFMSVAYIKDENVMMVSALLFFIAFGVSFVLFTKFMNKQ